MTTCKAEGCAASFPASKFANIRAGAAGWLFLERAAPPGMAFPAPSAAGGYAPGGASVRSRDLHRPAQGTHPTLGQ